MAGRYHEARASWGFDGFEPKELFERLLGVYYVVEYRVFYGYYTGVSLPAGMNNINAAYRPGSGRTGSVRVTLDRSVALSRDGRWMCDVEEYL